MDRTEILDTETELLEDLISQVEQAQHELGHSDFLSTLLGALVDVRTEATK